MSPAAALRLRRRRSVAVPLARRVPRFLGTGLTFAFFGAIGIYGASVGGQAAAARAAYGEPRDIAARAVGFGLDRITISGLARLDQTEVLSIAGIDPRHSLLFLSAAEIRERLERVPLIKSASVRKLYPSALAIDLVERTPAALWQKDGVLHVVSADGAVIDAALDRSVVVLPLVVGEGANLRAAEYAALLSAAGPLRSKIRAGMLVSGRRWNLKMENGLDVKLPEIGADAALARLAKLDREHGLLEKDVLSVDMRIPDRVLVRLTEEAASARAELVKKKPQRGQKGLDT